jgi:sigma-B regulation protein RsbU (phosphoserine phosphatase)
MVRRVTGPLARLTSIAEALPGQGFRMPEQTVAAVSDIARHRDEVGRLAATFLAMEQALQHFLAELRETTASRARIKSELRVAREIQMGILPKASPPFPDRPEIDLHASIVPAREMGGDLYDYFLVDHDTLCIVVGDVSGKGVPAALFMAVTSTLVRTVAQRTADPAAILAKVNDELSAENEACMFVTLFVGLLDLRSGDLRYASAGHNPPLLLAADDRPALLPVTGQPVAGPVSGATYTTQVLKMGTGDALLLYTDGVTEAMNERGVVLGARHLLGRAEDAPVASARELTEWVMAEVASFTGGAPQSDDIAVLAVRCDIGAGATSGAASTPPAPSGDWPIAGTPMSLRLPARLENLRLFRAYAAASFARWSLPDDLAMRAELALEEVVVNAMTHAYPDQCGIVELSCALDQSAAEPVVCLTVRDWGPGFDPTAADEPDLGQSMAERPLGGVGLVLVRSLTDDLTYRRLDDGNALTFCVDLGSG